MNILCTWNFHGPRSEGIAAHFLEHTLEFFLTNNLPTPQSGIKKISDFHYQAEIIITENQQILVKTALKPHQMSPLTT